MSPMFYAKTKLNLLLISITKNVVIGCCHISFSSLSQIKKIALMWNSQTLSPWRSVRKSKLFKTLGAISSSTKHLFEITMPMLMCEI